MKSGFIHVCFIIDKSGSMWGSENDVIGGFKSMIEEQRNQTEGSCAISLYQFDSRVKKDFIGKDVRSINENLEYRPGGCTAMNDGIGQAITEIGKWLSDMPEEERPEKNLIVIMTDGEENSSTEYSIDKIKDMIKEQTDKYNWSFMYLGTDITDADYSNSLGVTSAFGSKADLCTHYKNISKFACAYRGYSRDIDYATKNAMWDKDLITMANETTTDYEKTRGVTINSNTKMKGNTDETH